MITKEAISDILWILAHQKFENTRVDKLSDGSKVYMFKKDKYRVTVITPPEK